MEAWVIAPGGAIILALVIIIKIMVTQQRRINDHAERISRLEGRMGRDGDD